MQFDGLAKEYWGGFEYIGLDYQVLFNKPPTEGSYGEGWGRC